MVAVVDIEHRAQIAGAELEVVLDIQNRGVVRQAQVDAPPGHLAGARHQLHEPERAGFGTRVGHERTLLAHHAVHPVGVDVVAQCIGLDHIAVQYRKAQFEIVKVIGLARGKNRAVMPAPMARQHRGHRHLTVVQATGDPSPLTARRNGIAERKQLLRHLDAGTRERGAHFLRTGLHAHMLHGIRLANAVGREKTVITAFLGQRAV